MQLNQNECINPFNYHPASTKRAAAASAAAAAAATAT